MWPHEARQDLSVDPPVGLQQYLVDSIAPGDDYGFVDVHVAVEYANCEIAWLHTRTSVDGALEFDPTRLAPVLVVGASWTLGDGEPGDSVGLGWKIGQSEWALFEDPGRAAPAIVMPEIPADLEFESGEPELEFADQSDALDLDGYAAFALSPQSDDSGVVYQSRGRWTTCD